MCYIRDFILFEFTFWLFWFCIYSDWPCFCISWVFGLADLILRFLLSGITTGKRCDEKIEMGLLTLSALWILSSVLGWIWSLHLLLFFSCEQISFLYRLWTSRSLWHFAGDVSCWCLALLFEGASWFVCSGIHLIHQFNGCTSGSYWSTLLESLMSFDTIRWGSSSILFSESDLMFGLWLSWNITTHGHGLDLAGHRAIIILVSTTWCLLLAGTLWVLRTYLAWICLTILLFHIH